MRSRTRSRSSVSSILMPQTFRDSLPTFAFALALAPQGGFRRGQRSAIFSVLAHLSASSTPALTVMPTGTGKTGVIMALPYLLQSARTLIVVPSQLLRSQLADDFRTLRTLTRIGVVPDNATPPRTIEVKKRLTTQAAWQSLRDYDVAVATPLVCSPAIHGVTAPPNDLFDLVIVDEAHHEPATSWNALLEQFSGINRVYLTATPFRRDKRHVDGTLVFAYDVAQAKRDGVYGTINFHPVTPADGQSADIAIADAALDALNADRADGRHSRLLVRAASQRRANELIELYQHRTGRSFAIVHSGLTSRTVAQRIAQLRCGDLDGVVCVNMMGEGFDLPDLRIAALHSPHKSLGVTLQFLGRFARISEDNDAPSAVFAVPDELQAETQELFRADSSWDEVIPALADAQVSQERGRRDFADHTVVAQPPEPDLARLSVRALNPQRHIKVYETDPEAAVDLSPPPELPGRLQSVARWIDDRGHYAIAIIAEVQRKKWSLSDLIASKDYDLLIACRPANSPYLMISSTRRSTAFYEKVAYTWTRGQHQLVLRSHLKRLLRGLTQLQCSNIGMRSRFAGRQTESYRIIAGSSCDRAISTTISKQFAGGHVSCSGIRDGVPETIGFSSSSKVWSPNTGDVSDLITWMNRMAGLLTDARPFRVDGQLNRLTSSEPISVLPAEVFAARWPAEAYTEQVQLRLANGRMLPLCDTDLIPARIAGDRTSVDITAKTEDGVAVLRLDLTSRIPFSHVGGDALVVIEEGDDVPLETYVNNNPIELLTTDLSIVSGREVDRLPDESPQPGAEIRYAVDWSGAQITVEVGDIDDLDNMSVHGCIARHLRNSNADVILYDHGQYELADFVTIRGHEDAVEVELFHCKRSGGASPGLRVDDVYEVCGQAIKCAAITSVTDFRKRFAERAAASPLLRGSMDLASSLLDGSRPVRRVVVIVQPGLSFARMTGKRPEVRNILRASSFFVDANGATLRIACSD